MSDFWNRLTVVFIVHNSVSVLPDVIKSLEGAKNLIIIDNASSDGSADLAQRLRPDAEIIHNPDNTGVSMPSNMAFEKVGTEFVLHMNPDTHFDNACVKRLVDTMDEDPGAAVISPMIINANGNQEIDLMGPGEIEHHKIEVPPEGPFCTWYVCGSVWLW
ncbi:MAG TPA: glycosyltransferase, partial [Alphaproteobacteria bacterium]|nr:glycosyltransferase [Alphaproteobacteria bacterium]